MEWNHANLKKKSQRIDRAVRHMLTTHRDEDKKGETDVTIRQRQEKQIDKSRFTVDDFTIDIDQQRCICPAGKELWLNVHRPK